MCKRITAILLALLLCVGGIPFTVMADTGATSDDLTLLFEDTFDSYGRETSISATSMVDFFHSEANVYGNGYIRVTQGESDNWYLESNVFTEVFNETPIVGSYAFSLDVLGAGGAVSSGVFVRGLDTAPCFYEADGHPGSSTGQSGLFLYPRESQLGVNIKTYDPNWTEWDAFVQNNTIMFDLPTDVTYPYNIKVTDIAKEITVYVNDTLMCRIDISNPGKTYEKHCSNDECYGTATLYGADGAVLGNYTDTLLGSFGSIFGWATRATDISVDNVRVWIGKAQQTILAIEKLPASVNTSNLDKAKELVAAARDLYDGLSADEKDLISNYENLLKLEAGIREVEETLNVKWSDPAYTEMETTSEDTAEGTLKYTLSEDGTTVTISYAVNGETLSHTVPNHDNYLFGGYAATDDLGRSLYDSYEVGSYGSGQERYVGLFYFLCQGEHGRSDNLVDLQKVLDKYGPEVAGQKNDTIYPEGANFWWGEPLYGYYYSTDAWVMRKHAELLTLAGVDFLYFDVTNGYTYIHNATKLMECLHDLNEQGFDAPQVVFYTSSNSEDVIRQLYDKIYSENIYPDTWFRVNGKPVIIGMSDFDMDGFFTVKRRMWPTDANVVENGWPWMDFNWPQRAIKNRAGDGSAISVSVAQHSMFPFSDSSLYGNCMNRGRSYNNPDNVRYRGNISQDYRQTLENSYNAWLSDETLTMHGINLQKQFDNAVE